MVGWDGVYGGNPKYCRLASDVAVRRLTTKTPPIFSRMYSTTSSSSRHLHSLRPRRHRRLYSGHRGPDLAVSPPASSSLRHGCAAYPTLRSRAWWPMLPLKSSSAQSPCSATCSTSPGARQSPQLCSPDRQRRRTPEAYTAKLVLSRLPLPGSWLYLLLLPIASARLGL